MVQCFEHGPNKATSTDDNARPTPDLNPDLIEPGGVEVREQQGHLLGYILCHYCPANTSFCSDKSFCF